MSLALGIGLGLPFRGEPFSPASLFAASEPGVWYDPSDLTTLFQDTAGTTPVTAAGQTVARINDKSGRGNHATQATADSRPTYQVDGNGKSYLSFDGIDDFLVTPTITPGTDKVQVFAGVRKLSDAALAMLVEIDGVAALQTFFVAAPRTAATGDYAFRSAGSAASQALTPASYVAPITNTLTALGDISGDLARLRVNGVQAAQNTADQGTGNYNPAPLYIGRRAGTSLPFNGRLYGLVVRFGANLTTPQIASAENWMNTRTGAY